MKSFLQSKNSWAYVFRFLVITLIFLAVFFRVMASRPVWMNGDENYYLNIFQNFVDRGEITPYMWRLGEGSKIIAGSGTGYGIYILVGWMLIFGESLLAMRALMITAGIITAWVYYLIAKEMWQSQEAGITALIFGLVSTSAFFTFIARMDALAILAYSIVLLIHLRAIRKKNKWLHLLVGIGAILTVEIHVLGLLYLGAFAFYYGIRYIQSAYQNKKIQFNTPEAFFFYGAGIFGVLYIIIHILPDPAAYFLIPNSCEICMPDRLTKETYRIIKMFIFRPHEAALIFLIAYFSIKTWKTHLHFLLLTLGFWLSQIIVSPPHYIQYTQHILPLMAIGISGVLPDFIKKAKNQNRTKVMLLMASILLLIGNFYYPSISNQLPYENSNIIPSTPEIQFIQENLPESTVILGHISVYYPLKEYRNFVDYSDQIKYGLILRDEDLDNFYNRVGLQAIYLKMTIFENNTTLQEYVQEHGFIQITPDLWVDPALLLDEQPDSSG